MSQATTSNSNERIPVAESQEDSPPNHAQRDELQRRIRQAVSSLGEDKLWCRESLKPIYAMASEAYWRVDLELGKRREALARRHVTAWADKETGISSVYRLEEFDELSAQMANLETLVAEYDTLRLSSAVTHFNPDVFAKISESELRPMRRLAELRGILREHGIDCVLRDRLLDILIDFDVALNLTLMMRGSLDPVECKLLEPVAEYLNLRKVQNSYITRHLTIRFIACLRMAIKKRATAVAKVGQSSTWLALAAIGMIFLFAHFDLIRFVRVFSVLSFCISMLVLGFILVCRWYLRGAEADRILTQLYSDFGRLPVTYDGRELKSELRKVQKLGVVVPSLLFSLFEITFPGY